MPLKTFKFDKIIRDKVYQMLIDNNVVVKLKKNKKSKEIIHYFKKKLLEESYEVSSAKKQTEIIEELADCIEVIHGFAKAIGITFEDIEKARQDKLNKNGGFQKQIIVEHITLSMENPLASYYSQRTNKYSELER